ncbi:saccharopine dehydrogenase [Chitinophaga caeni]|uniref:Saccharopine dehydrogenase n=1 Tax=Chitinophaga caeni TaxID=2029983 RepID=A0A291QW88_9BACT|nr:saccharopine dehydrogenase C-terminal domain-containing protein [Chitinophaga caeni]ATL48299.1 saccharopine dehydrogenase [Chitinophaga caeni]
MKHVLLFGAGKSATCLIDYLLANAPKYKWHLTVVDSDLLLIKSKIGKSYYASPAAIDIKDQAERQKLIQETDLVISLLPPHLHITIAKDCLKFKKNLLTASYIDPEISKLAKDIEDANLLFMYEMGLDPGIDHMSAMKLIHSIEKKGGQIFSFKSYCGGLVSPDSNDNPWEYKISWNARNVVLAGSSGAIYREKGKIKELGYKQLFDHNKTVNIPGLGKLAFYPNRDSLNYIDLYNLQNIPTFMRATLRYPDFCEGWNALIKLGLTKDADKFDTSNLSFLKWSTRAVKMDKSLTIEDNMANFLGVTGKSKVIKQLKFLGIFSEELINLGDKNDAEILQHVLENQLRMEPHDKDMIVMLHEIDFERRDLNTKMQSYMIVQGEDNLRTAMAKTVGLPLGILAKMVLLDKVDLKGLHIPVLPSIYNPVLKELEEHDIRFEEIFD